MIATDFLEHRTTLADLGRRRGMRRRRTPPPPPPPPVEEAPAEMSGMDDLGKFKFSKIRDAVRKVAAPIVSAIPVVGGAAGALIAKKPAAGGGNTTIINQAAPAAPAAAVRRAAPAPAKAPAKSGLAATLTSKPVLIGAGIAAAVLVVAVLARK